MIQWLCNVLFKDYINDLVDQRFHERAYERANQLHTQQLQKRIAELRQSIDNNSSMPTSIQDPINLTPKNIVKDSQDEIKIQNKSSDLDDIKAKLMGRKNQ